MDGKPAIVRPRVYVPGTREAVLLEDAVQERIETRRFGLIELTGPAGSGKSTAISHLAHVFGNGPLRKFLDRPQESVIRKLFEAAGDQIVVYTAPDHKLASTFVEHWWLASWGLDECIEYLLATHREQCASVMQRLKADAGCGWLGGLPELWPVVLERMVADESLKTVKTALRQAMHARLPTATALTAARTCCAMRLLEPNQPIPDAMQLWQYGGIGGRILSLLRHSQVQMLLASEHVAEQLRAELEGVLERPLPEALMQEVAGLVRGDENVLNWLRSRLAHANRNGHAMAASLLQLAGANWVPSLGYAPRLVDACLAGVSWPRVNLVLLEIANADLSDADLSEARLERVFALGTNFSRANLHGALLINFNASEAVFADADLSFVRAENAHLCSADLRRADLEGALLKRANLSKAYLRGANFRRADLTGAWFGDCHLDDADFSGADLSFAELSKVVLRRADFTGAKFYGATLNGCDLEGMRLPGANFEKALLAEACLSSSHMPSASFRGADLTSAGLADIDWEGADLRDADLTWATFHMGSSRSGLVGSPIACEGSRTGFYTDELNEQDFKSPEEIRKANLCGANLCGAKVDHTDFYLVDLRNAKYTSEQAEHFRRCGAILEARV